MEEQGMCYDGIFRVGTGPKSHVVAFFGPSCTQGEMYFVQFDPKPLPWGALVGSHW